jgi:hypothetical protein
VVISVGLLDQQSEYVKLLYGVGSLLIMGCHILSFARCVTSKLDTPVCSVHRLSPLGHLSDARGGGVILLSSSLDLMSWVWLEWN